MANEKATRMTVDKIRKFITEEIAETETALELVLVEVAKASSDYGRVFSRKKAEYEGALDAYRSVLNLMDGGEDDSTDAS
jgi:hypothetical protein